MARTDVSLGHRAGASLMGGFRLTSRHECAPVSDLSVLRPSTFQRCESGEIPSLPSKPFSSLNESVKPIPPRIVLKVK